jgi:hypothetical protein
MQVIDLCQQLIEDNRTPVKVYMHAIYTQQFIIRNSSKRQRQAIIRRIEAGQYEVSNMPFYLLLRTFYRLI